MAQQREPSKIKSDILTRVRVLYVLFALVGLVILARLIWIQISPEVRTQSAAIEERIFRKDTLLARRGNILARNGEALATSIFRYRILFDFSAEGFDSLQLFREQSDSLAELLAAYFRDRSHAQYRDLMWRLHDEHYRLVPRKDTAYYNASTRFGRWINRLRGVDTLVHRTLYDTVRDRRLCEVLPRAVDYAEWQELKHYPILNWNMGMTYRREPYDERVYPQGELGRRTIGLYHPDRGSYGIEAVCREALAGKGGAEWRQRIAHGFSGRVAGHKGNIDPEDGADVVTTLDPDVQDVADKALRSQLTAQNALWGTTIVMECNTGEVLALVNLGRRGDGSYGELENYALSRRTEPGSTFKLASLLALVEDCGADLDLSYDTGHGKRVEVGRSSVVDDHDAGGELDMLNAFAQSSNVFFARAVYEAYKGDSQRYVDFLKRLHLDRAVGLEAYGERAPLLQEPGKKGWYPHVTLPNMGYGYAVELTPMQVATLYNAVANDGEMVAPRLVKEIRRGDKVVERFEKQVLVEKICSEEALRKVRRCLEEVPRSGTAHYYFRDTSRYRVGAKTGTAQFAQGDIHYSDGYYLGTMVCYLPAEAPRYTVLTSIFTQRGRGRTIYGAGLAGPVEKAVADYLSTREVHPFEGEGGCELPTQIKGGDLAAVKRVADHYDVEVEGLTRRGWGAVKGDSLGLRVQTVAGQEVVPDVRGMGLKDALFLLESRGLKVKFSGRGAVKRQQPAAGEPLKRGTTITITLE